MGIKNMHVFLKRNGASSIYETIPMESLRDMKIAVDTSIYMCRFKSSMGTKWLQGFWNLVLTFKEHGIIPLFVYDSKAPPEKEHERQLRQDSKTKIQQRILTLGEEWDAFDKISQSLEGVEEFAGLYKIVKRFSMKTKEELLEYILRIENSGTKIQSRDFDLTKDLFHHCGFSTMQAPGEAEALCAFLNRKHLVDAVLTEDTDVLAYRTPVMFHHFDMSAGVVTRITTEDILRILDISDDSFLDFAICCGTDYNRNISKIGPQRAFDLIRKYHTIDKIPNVDTSCLNYVRVREIFNPEYGITTIDWNEKPVEWQALQRFCFENNLRKEDKMRQCFHQ
jgi:5'-3' exonuclease